MPDGQRRFRPDIEGLRAVAVIAVVLSHASLGLPGGYVGVDVFFVISGFLITRQLLEEAERRGRFSFAKFYARRVRRIVPAATLVTIATLVGAYFWAAPLRLGTIARDGLTAALFGVNWRFAAQGTDYFQASGPPSPFQHYWSLSVEEQFYLCWPLLLAVVLFAFRRRVHRRAALVAVLGCLVGASLWASVHVTNASAPYGYFGTHTRVWELAFGALIAATAGNLQRLPRVFAAWLAWLGLVAIVVSCVIYSSDTLYPGAAAALPVVGAGLVICAGCGAYVVRGPERLLWLWPIRWTGRISYSLYLWHWPLLVLLPEAVGHPLALGPRLAAIGVAVVLSALTYAFVEQPFQQSRVLVAKPRRAFMLATGLIGAAAAVTLVVPTLITIPGGSGRTALAATLARPAQLSASSPSSAAPGAAAKADVALLKKDLTAAAKTEQLPADLTPSLVAAASDYPNSHGCEIDDSSVVPPTQCSDYGDPNGTQLVVLIGDSHAGMWLGAVNEIAVAHHLRLAFFAKSGCPLGDYPDYVNPSLKRVYTECNSWRTAVIAQVVGMHPALIVVGSQARSIAAAEPNGFETSLKALKASGAKIAFLADTPSPADEGSVPDCLSQHPNHIETCDLPRKKAVKNVPGRLAEIDGARRAGATVIDPTPWFCTTSTCPAVVQDTVVYEDNSHITAAYARLVTPELDQALTPLLR